jgi:hypothetical protein
MREAGAGAAAGGAGSATGTTAIVGGKVPPTGRETGGYDAGGGTGGPTSGAAAAEECQNGINKSEAEDEDSSSCTEGRSGGATEASVDATNAGAWGESPGWEGRIELG